jgi:hypothetical protein
MLDGWIMYLDARMQNELEALARLSFESSHRATGLSASEGRFFLKKV